MLKPWFWISPVNLILGLLGLNYLQNFRMDMNTEEGVLLLEPR